METHRRPAYNTISLVLIAIATLEACRSIFVLTTLPNHPGNERMLSLEARDLPSKRNRQEMHPVEKQSTLGLREAGLLMRETNTLGHTGLQPMEAKELEDSSSIVKAALLETKPEVRFIETIEPSDKFKKSKTNFRRSEEHLTGLTDNPASLHTTTTDQAHKQASAKAEDNSQSIHLEALDPQQSNATDAHRPHFLGPDFDRSIILVHVGKAGGMTIRANLAANCKSMKFSGTETEQNWKLHECMNNFKKNQKLSLQTRDVFHVWYLNQTAMEHATSLVVTLRSPVDRIISTYRYSHPDNCIKRKGIPATAGCHLIDRGGLEGPHKLGYTIFRHCFPSPAMETFAQSLLPPWHPVDGFQNFTHEEKTKCRQHAKTLVEGQPFYGVIPHMRWNYDHYAGKSWGKYPDKEVFGIRTEHEWDDMVKLDKMIGGSGKFKKHGNSVSHGSELYHPSPISQEAYQKLCCVLENEIEVYLQVLNLSLNLDLEAKQGSEEKLREKCGIETSWSEWRTQCQQRLNVDYEEE